MVQGGPKYAWDLYSPNMALGTNNVDASMKNSVRLLQNMPLDRDVELICQQDQQASIPKLHSQHILRMPLGSLITTLHSSWPQYVDSSQ